MMNSVVEDMVVSSIHPSAFILPNLEERCFFQSVMTIPNGILRLW